jgi:hypothetical protein
MKCRDKWEIGDSLHFHSRNSYSKPSLVQAGDDVREVSSRISQGPGGARSARLPSSCFAISNTIQRVANTINEYQDLGVDTLVHLNIHDIHFVV